MTPLVIIGCGGFGRLVHDVVEAINAQNPTWDVLGYVDDDPSSANLQLIRRRGCDVVGGMGWFDTAADDVHYVIGIGSPMVKRQIADRLGRRGVATLVHPSAVLGFDVTLGPGTVICANTVMMTNIRLGRHVHVNPLCSIGHDAVIHDYVSINPLTAISGWVVLGDGVLVGTNAAILQNLKVGENATVGAGACVVRDVPAGSIAMGVPAR